MYCDGFVKLSHTYGKYVVGAKHSKVWVSEECPSVCLLFDLLTKIVH